MLMRWCGGNKWLRRDQKINRSTDLARGAGSLASKTVNTPKEKKNKPSHSGCFGPARRRQWGETVFSKIQEIVMMFCLQDLGSRR